MPPQPLPSLCLMERPELAGQTWDSTEGWPRLGLRSLSFPEQGAEFALESITGLA